MDYYDTLSQIIAAMSGFTKEETALLRELYDTTSEAAQKELIAVAEKVRSAMLHYQNGTHLHFRREHARKKVKGYRIVNEIQIGTTEIVLFEDEIGHYSEKPYLVADWRVEGPNPVFHDIVYGQWTDVLKEFTARLARRANMMETLLEKAQHSDRPLYFKDCEPDSGEQDWTGKVVVLLPALLYIGHQYAENQLFYAEKGPGCVPKCADQAMVYGIHLLTGERWSARRNHFFGVLKPERIPDWAQAQIREFN